MGGYERHSAPWALDEHRLDAIPRRLQRPAARGGLAALRGDRRELAQARAGDGRDQGHAADQRPRGVHARQRVLPRRERGARASSSPPASAPTGSPGAGGIGKRDGRVDPRRRARARRLGDGHPPLRRRTTARRATRSSARQEVYETYYDIRYPGHERQAGRPLRTSSAYPWHARARRRLRREVGLGARQLVRAQRRRRRRVAAPARLGGHALVAGDRRRAPRHARARRRCSTSPRSPSSRSPGPGAARASSSACATTASRARSARSPTRRCSTAAAASSATSPSRASREELLLRSSPAPRSATTTSSWIRAPRCRATAACAAPTSPRAGRASRCGGRARARSSRR